MDKQTKIIIGLLVFIVVLVGAFVLKVTGGIEGQNNSNQTESIAQDNILNETKSYENVNNVIKDKEENTEENYSILNKDLIFKIIDVVVILLIVPMLLKKYNLIINVIALTLYKLITLLLLSTIAIDFTTVFFLLIFILIYSYVFLTIVNKFLLDVDPIMFFIGIIIVDSIVYYITIFMFSFFVAGILG